MTFDNHLVCLVNSVPFICQSVNGGDVGSKTTYLFHLVYFVCLVDLVCFVYLVHNKHGAKNLEFNDVEFVEIVKSVSIDRNIYREEQDAKHLMEISGVS